MNSPPNTLKRLHSSLSRRLIALFSLIVIIQTLFIGILAYDVDAATKAAAKQLQYLELAQEAGLLVRTALQAWNFGSGMMEKKSKGTDAYKNSFNRLMAGLDSYDQRLKDSGIELSLTTPLHDSISKLNDFVSPLAGSGPLMSLKLREILKFEFMACDTFKEFLNAVHKLEAMERGVKVSKFLGIKPLDLLYLSSALNFVLLLVAVLFVDRQITSPITRLIENCKRLDRCELMPAPQSTNTEIGMLEDSLYQMSATLSENEKCKRSYIEMLKVDQSDSLQRILNVIDNLSRNDGTNERLNRVFKTFKSNISNLLGLVATISEGLGSDLEFNPEYQPVSLQKLMEDSCAAVEPLLKQLSITIDTKPLAISVELDEKLISRVLTNFLSNAIKYSPDQGKINFRASSELGTLRIEVQDKGPGLTAENIKKLFKKFSQVESLDGVRRAGTGLGLAICKDIIEAHNGSVGCESEAGAGSTFWFQIPLTQNPKTDARNNLNTEVTEKEKPAGKDKPVIQGNPAIQSKPAIQGNPAVQGKPIGGRISLGKDSIKVQFGRILVLFLLSQFVVVLSLNNEFSQSSRKLHQFDTRRKVMFRTQDLLGNWCIMVRLNEVAVLTRNFDVLRRSKEALVAQMEQTDQILKLSNPKSEIYKQVEKIRKHLQVFRKIMDYALKEGININAASMAVLANKVMSHAAQASKEIWHCIEIEKSDLETSYAWVQETQSDLLKSLLLSGLLDFLLFGFAVFQASKITNRISTLSSKTKELASGKTILPSIPGQDELSILDLRLYTSSMAIKQAEEERQVFLATINHDLRTPIGSISNGLELYQSGAYGPVGDGQSEIAQKAITELLVLVKQINNLLLIEKIDSGTLTPQFENEDLSEILEDCVDKFEEASAKADKKVPIKLSIAAECRTHSISCQRDLLEQLFKAIIENAAEASPPGAEIGVAMKARGEDVLVSIEDRGAGIDQKLLPQLFQRFRFIENHKPITGLGLPLSDRICKLHGIKINIDSNSNAGTKVELYLQTGSNAR